MPSKGHRDINGAPYSRTRSDYEVDESVTHGASIGLNPDDIPWAKRCVKRHAADADDEKLMLEAIGIIPMR